MTYPIRTTPTFESASRIHELKQHMPRLHGERKRTLPYLSHFFFTDHTSQSWDHRVGTELPSWIDSIQPDDLGWKALLGWVST